MPFLYTPPPLTVNLYGNIASSNLFTLPSKSLRSPPLPVPDSYQVPSNVASPLLLIVPYAIVSVPTTVPAFKVPPLKYIAHPSGIVIADAVRRSAPSEPFRAATRPAPIRRAASAAAPASRGVRSVRGRSTPPLPPPSPATSPGARSPSPSCDRMVSGPAPCHPGAFTTLWEQRSL